MPGIKLTIGAVALLWEGIIFLVLNERTLETGCWIKRKKSTALALVVICSAGLVAIGFAASPFCWELAQDAASLTIHRTFSTTLWVIFRDLAVAAYVAIKIRKRWGSEEVKYLQTGKDAAEALTAAFLLTAIYHLAVTIPWGISATALGSWPPPVVEHLRPRTEAYEKSIHQKPPIRESDEPMDRGYPHVVALKIHLEFGNSYATIVMENIGRYRIIPPVVSRGAIIPSRLLMPDEEEKYLFSGHENGMFGALLEHPGDYWDPGDTRAFTIKDRGGFTPTDWADVNGCTKENCKRVVYVVTKTYSQDKFGGIRPKESCWYVSAMDWNNAKKCFGHND